MYKIINDNISSINNAINRSRDIDPYMTLQTIFQNGSILNNGNFKTIYRKYWQLNAARLSDTFCDHYFQVLEKNRNKEDRNIKEVVEDLYRVSSNAKNKKTLQFAFATKLLHTIDNTLPVYDSLVADFYFLPQIKLNWKYDKKISTYLKAYEFLQKEHKRILDGKLLSSAITRFRTHFALPASYTDQKIIDTLLWKFTSVLRAGAIREGKIKYS